MPVISLHQSETPPGNLDEPLCASDVTRLSQRSSKKNEGDREEETEASASQPDDEQRAPKKQKVSDQDDPPTQSNSETRKTLGQELQFNSQAPMHPDDIQNLLRLQEAHQRGQLGSPMPPISQEQMLYNQYLGNPGGQFLNNPGGQFLNNPGGQFLNNPGGQFLNNPGGQFLNNPGDQFLNSGSDITFLNRLNNDVLLLNQQLPGLGANSSFNSLGYDYDVMQRLHLLDRMRMLQEANSFPYQESLSQPNLTANRLLDHHGTNQSHPLAGNINFKIGNDLNTRQKNVDSISPAANPSSNPDPKSTFNVQSQGCFSNTLSSTLNMGPQDTEKLEPAARRISCRARHMPITHNEVSAYFEITSNSVHGSELSCSHPECRKNGTKFRYCAFCKVAAAKRNFITRHGHCEAKTKEKQIQEKAST
eukprot:CAMPEP_0194283774 /NCGR_PEP_ID=MMETSP0169-20130528/26093_1 /TAXON_ID=218684 /ORGANISM="Corethron pennatum, Strain L29A3" /LENGTH=419 /DNA_ID=CAMNT_0039029443 /DNA_START=353 /DNA_END=1612 /DNA_ORIENTATION=+